MTAAAVAAACPAGASAGARPAVLVAGGPDAAVPVGARPVAELATGLRVWSVRVPPGTTARAFARAVRARAGVVAAQPDARLRAQQAQSPGTCALGPPTTFDASVPATVNGLGVRAATTKPIAVLDTGVGASTPELAGRLVSPFNALVGGADVSDRDGHGTQVAGVAAGRSGLFQGASPTSPVMPVKIFQSNGLGTAEGLVKGIDAAVKAGAGVINISGASPASDAAAGDVSVVTAAITAATASGALVVVAAGNDGTDKPYVPGNLPHVLTVGGMEGDARATFSNTGPFVDVLALGRVMAPMPPELCSTGFGPAAGTSFAAPAAAGVAALVQQLRPGLGPDALAALLRHSARDLGPAGRDDDDGWGVLDAAAALKAPLPAADPGEVDDDVFWVRGPFASLHRPLLSGSSRRAVVRARLSATKDLVDVRPVRLRRGDRLSVSVTGTSGAILGVSIWDPRTGDFDVGRETSARELVPVAGYASNPRVSWRARRAGVHYVVVETAPPPDRTEEPDADAPHAEEPYTMTVSVKRPGKAKKTSRRRR